MERTEAPELLGSPTDGRVSVGEGRKAVSGANAQALLGCAWFPAHRPKGAGGCIRPVSQNKITGSLLGGGLGSGRVHAVGGLTQRQRVGHGIDGVAFIHGCARVHVGPTQKKAPLGREERMAILLLPAPCQGTSPAWSRTAAATVATPRSMRAC